METSHPKRGEIDGTPVAFHTFSGTVSSVRDASYEQRWTEHVGSTPNVQMAFTNGRPVQVVTYDHHYVERSQTVERRVVSVNFDEQDGRPATGRPLGDCLWETDEIAIGDRVTYVCAGNTIVRRVNETRGYWMALAPHEAQFAEPWASTRIERTSRWMSGGNWFWATVGAAVVFGLMPGLAHGTISMSLQAAIYGGAFALVASLTFALAWSIRLRKFHGALEQGAIRALVRMRFVREGKAFTEADRSAFADFWPTTEPEAPLLDVPKPLWVRLAELAGCAVYPPENSAQRRRQMADSLGDGGASSAGWSAALESVKTREERAVLVALAGFRETSSTKWTVSHPWLRARKARKDYQRLFSSKSAG